MFKKKTVKTEEAFGKIEAFCKYELFMERYRSPAEIMVLQVKRLARTKVSADYA